MCYQLTCRLVLPATMYFDEQLPQECAKRYFYKNYVANDTDNLREVHWEKLKMLFNGPRAAHCYDNAELRHSKLKEA